MNAPSRSLGTPPTAFWDRSTRRPAFGSYAGPLPPIELPKRRVGDRVVRRKKWLWIGLVSEDAWITLGVVRTGYAATAFAFVYDLRARTMLVDRTVLGPAPAARVSDDPHAQGVIARFWFARGSIVCTRALMRMDVRARFEGLDVKASIDERHAPPSVSAIAPLGGRLFDATEKRALASVRGRARLGGRTIDLDGATAGWDYTHGLLPRRTRWRWGFALGRAASGAPLALNLVEGFVGEAECAAFYDGGVHALPEPRFLLDADEPGLPSRLRSEALDLEFSPGAVHTQNRDLVVVRSRFFQAVGTFRGRVRIGGLDVAVTDLPGVVEDQDVVW